MCNTDLSCYHCTEPFEETPATFPTAYNESTQTWETIGVFCSWACAKRFGIERPGYSSGQSAVWLRTLAAQMGHDAPIEAAPPQWALSKFGGPLDLAVFRKGNGGKNIELLHRPFISYPMVFRGIQDLEYSNRRRHAFNPGCVTGLRRPVKRSESREIPRTGEGAYTRYLRQQAPTTTALVSPIEPPSTKSVKRSPRKPRSNRKPKRSKGLSAFIKA